MRLKQRINRFRERGNFTFSWVVAAIIGVALIVLSPFALYWYYSHDLPDLTNVTGYKPALMNEVYSSNGALVGEFGTERRRLIPSEDIPEYVRDAFISIEDKRFFEHTGVDIRSIFAAFLQNLWEGEIIRGGSTITQQVAKNLVLSPEKSFSRKIKEAMLAERMEKNLSKDEILYIYLNHIYLADGNYGIETASLNYFGKSSKDINLAEAALLAALPRAPEYYSPRKYPWRAQGRQKLVLQKMQEEGFITEAQRREAESYKVAILPRRNINFDTASYFVELIRQYVEDKFGEKAFREGGYTIFTSLDVNLNLAAQWALRRGILELDSRHGKGMISKRLKNEQDIKKFRASQKIDKIEDLQQKPYDAVVLEVTDTEQPNVFLAKVGIGKLDFQVKYAVSTPFGAPVKGLPFPISKTYAPLNGYEGIGLTSIKFQTGDVIKVKPLLDREGENYAVLDYQPEFQGALMAMDTNGYVKAVIGGYDFLDSQFNRATQARRQPGSSFKPIVFAAALDKGYTETTTVYDAPVVMKDWSPQNYDGNYLGAITLREALAKSRNLASVRILLDINANYVVNYANKFKFTSRLNPYPSLALGGSEVTLIEMVKAFNVFASGGRLVEPKFILRIYDRYGNIVEDVSSGEGMSVEDFERGERENRRLAIIKQIAKRLGKNTDNEESKKQGTDKGGNSAMLAADEYLAGLRSKSVELPDDSGDQIISPETAYIVTDLMQAVIREGTGRAALRLTSMAPLAGKTGTTNDYADAWFIGFSPKIVTGVWVGKDNHQPIGRGEVGGKAALPIWMDFMREALSEFPGGDFRVPNGVRIINTPYGYIPYKVSDGGYVDGNFGTIDKVEGDEGLIEHEEPGYYPEQGYDHGSEPGYDNQGESPEGTYQYRWGDEEGYDNRDNRKKGYNNEEDYDNNKEKEYDEEKEYDAGSGDEDSGNEIDFLIRH